MSDPRDPHAAHLGLLTPRAALVTDAEIDVALHAAAMVIEDDSIARNEPVYLAAEAVCSSVRLWKLVRYSAHRTSVSNAVRSSFAAMINLIPTGATRG